MLWASMRAAELFLNYSKLRGASSWLLLPCYVAARRRTLHQFFALRCLFWLRYLSLPSTDFTARKVSRILLQKYTS